jgi:hypothetical protein
MTFEAWPSPDAPRGPLPRIDDLPIAEQGYDQEAVREAFDSFYRHAAQLDASLKALEAVEAFRREATELRADLRSLRALGYGGLEPSWTPSSYTYERPSRELPPGVLRVAGEAALIVAVAVAAGVGHFRAWVTIVVMAAALVVVAFSEWLASRARYRVPEPVPLFAPEEEEAPSPELEVGWAALEAAAAEDEGAEPVAEEELTAVADAVVAGEELEPEPEPEAEPVAESEPEPDVEAVEPQPELEPEPAGEEQPRRRWFRRRDAAEAEREWEPEPEAEAPEAAPPPSHVRVLPAADPWERAFDGDEAGNGNEPELAEPGGIGRIRRRRR